MWFTGLSGAGKSTICFHLAHRLEQLCRRAQVLDGDELRHGLCADLGFSMADRAENVRRAMHVAGLLAAGGDIILVALITPLQILRDEVRAHLPTMLEVFVDAPLGVCEQRDLKGLYKRAREGSLHNFTGLNSPYEPPAAPDLTCLTHHETIHQSVSKVLERLLANESASFLQEDGRPKSVAVHFDGVIADCAGWKGIHNLEAPRPDVLAALKQLRIEGWKIIVYTMRGAESIRQYLIDADVPFDELDENSDYPSRGQKPVATVYWDDRAVLYSGNTTRDLTLIRNICTWSGRS